MPSAKWLRAQLAFKELMVRGILQFTPSIAFRYVLHRCKSRDIRCRESLKTLEQRSRASPAPGREGPGAWDGESRLLRFLGTIRADVVRSSRPRRPFEKARGDATRGTRAFSARELRSVRGDGSRVVLPFVFDNDPSAGSPTETLLRLLLPLNDKVQWTSRDVVGSEPPTSPRSEHFTGPFNR